MIQPGNEESETRLRLGERLGSPRRLRTGIAGLDAMLRGGIPRYATVVVAGEPGSGKTILCQQILFDNADDEHLLRIAGEKRARVRYVEVYKLRGVSHASGDHMMKITSRGIQIFPRVEEVRS